MANLPTLQILKLRDLDEIVEGYPGTDWNMALRQIGCGQILCQVRSLQFDDISVIWNTESLGSIADYTTPQETTLFAFQNVGMATCRWWGTDIPEDAMFITRPGRDHILSNVHGFDCFAISVPDSLLIEEGALFAQLADRPDHPCSWILPLGEKGVALRTWLRESFEDVEGLQIVAESPVAAALFRDTVYDGLLDILAQAAGRVLVRQSNSPRRFMLAERARHWIDEGEPGDLTASVLAAKLGVTSRELRYAFRYAYGISPYQYMLFDRLSKARRLLRASRPVRPKVSQVALEVGFPDFSRFSRFYRRTYGETPSDTLSRMPTD